MPGRRRDPEPLLVRGALFVKRRRCGKPSCKCARGEPHTSPALTYWAAGCARTLVLGEVDVEEVTAALARYRAARDELDGAAFPSRRETTRHERR